MRSPARALGALLALVPAIAAAACGPTGVEKVLHDTSEKLGDVRSAQMRLRISASAGASGEERPVGFSVEGPFALPAEKGALPVARLRVTRTTGGDEQNAVFVSTGDQAFLESGGTAYALPPERVRGLLGGEPGEGGLAGLDLDGWAEEPRLSGAGVVDGVAADRVTARLDVVKALDDLVEIAERMGAPAPAGLRRVEGDDERRLERAVRSARLEVVTGKEDRLLRALRVEVVFAAPVQRLEAALGRLAGARLRVELDLAKLNRPVRVDPPERTRPLGEMRDR